MNGGFDMQLPIYIDGNQEGTLTVERQGTMTVMRADLRDVGRVVRLSLFGEKSGYLGVPEPQDGRLRLTRRFTDLDMLRFPARIEYAAEGPLRERDDPPPAKTAPAEPGEKRHVLWMGGKPYYF